MTCCTHGTVSSRHSRRTASQHHVQQQPAGLQRALEYQQARAHGCGLLPWSCQQAHQMLSAVTTVEVAAAAGLG
jgi:hypothetical protein